MSVSKRTRFEVFKRDSFTCQYCGKKAPDVVLHADHIHPVALGGGDDLTNLITACEGCNLGKAAVPLSDDSALTKQRDQLGRLQERQEQLEMMMQWQRSLMELDQQSVDRLATFWCDLANWFGLTESGKRTIKRIARKYGHEAVLEAMRIASETYFRYADKDATSPTNDSTHIAFDKLSGICQVREQTKAKPWLPDFYYVRAIIRNRVNDHELSYWNDIQGLELLGNAFELGADPDRLKRIARECSSWTRWRDAMTEYIDSLEDWPT